jgi:hypothetical protein
MDFPKEEESCSSPIASSTMASFIMCPMERESSNSSGKRSSTRENSKKARLKATGKSPAQMGGTPSRASWQTQHPGQDLSPSSIPTTNPNPTKSPSTTSQKAGPKSSMGMEDGTTASSTNGPSPPKAKASRLSPTAQSTKAAGRKERCTGRALSAGRMDPATRESTSTAGSTVWGPLCSRLGSTTRGSGCTGGRTGRGGSTIKTGRRCRTGCGKMEFS